MTGDEVVWMLDLMILRDTDEGMVTSRALGLIEIWSCWAVGSGDQPAR